MLPFVQPGFPRMSSPCRPGRRSHSPVDPDPGELSTQHGASARLVGACAVFPSSRKDMADASKFVHGQPDAEDQRRSREFRGRGQFRTLARLGSMWVRSPSHVQIAILPSRSTSLRSTPPPAAPAQEPHGHGPFHPHSPPSTLSATQTKGPPVASSSLLSSILPFD